MSEAVEARDVAIELGGKTYVMRPSFKAVCEIEQVTGVGIAALAARLLNGEEKVSEIAAVITAGLREAGEPATFEKVGEMVFEAGIEKVLRPVIRFLTGLMGAGEGENWEASTQAEE